MINPYRRISLDPKANLAGGSIADNQWPNIFIKQILNHVPFISKFLHSGILCGRSFRQDNIHYGMCIVTIYLPHLTKTLLLLKASFLC